MDGISADANARRFTLPATELARLLADAHRHTLAMVADLPEIQWTVPEAENLNPFRWELGHVAFFHDVFVLRPQGLDAFLLSGAAELYDSFQIPHDERWGLPLPSVADTLAYKQRVFDRLQERLVGCLPDGDETYLHLLAVHHEDMHGEAFTTMRQTLGYPQPPLAAGTPATGGPLPGDVAIPGGAFLLGATPDAPFLFDNEKWAHPVEVAPFRIACAPVTNEEFAAFVADGGYRQQALWSHQGWRWREQAGVFHPLYWRLQGDGWQQRFFDRWQPLAPHAPVAHVNWFEAEAWCNWAGRRLPTEAEWEMAASAEPATDGRGLGARKRRYPWGDGPPTAEHANLDFRQPGYADVGAHPAGDSAFGCRQMLGNVWEWTASPFYPYPGFVVDSPYREYSAPWFGYSKVLKGGAWATRGRLATNTYRNFFRPHRRDPIAGFRTCAIA